MVKILGGRNNLHLMLLPSCLGSGVNGDVVMLCIWCCVFILPKSGRCWVSVFWCLTPAGQLSVYCHNSDSSPGLKAQGRGHRLLSAPFPLPLASYSRHSSSVWPGKDSSQTTGFPA